MLTPCSPTPGSLLLLLILGKIVLLRNVGFLFFFKLAVNAPHCAEFFAFLLGSILLSHSAKKVVDCPNIQDLNEFRSLRCLG